MSPQERGALIRAIHRVGPYGNPRIPEGTRAWGKKWKPSPSERFDGRGQAAYRHCQTLAHVSKLVDFGLAGMPVPADVAKVIGSVGGGVETHSTETCSPFGK